jgi:5-methylcytosine-specific restriction enzyme A
MTAYLITWNPLRFPWRELEETIAAVAESAQAPDRWSCGNNKSIKSGDRLFLLKQGADDPGLIGSGWATSEVFEEDHWEDAQSSLPRRARYIDMTWDFLLRSPVIARSELVVSPFSAVNWSTQVSGISIEPDAARALELEWGRRIGSHFEPLADEVSTAEFPEGSVQRAALNAFERNATARAACIAFYGCRCAVCGFDFEAQYGQAAHGLIHVHHLTPISQLRRRYVVNAIRDLRPVCPNCHAVLHRTEPPYTIDQVASMLGK